MKHIPILEYDGAMVGYSSPMLLRLPYYDIETLEGTVKLYLKQWGPLYGLLAPYTPDNVEFNIRCAARIRDRFPDQKVYIAVPKDKTYERFKTIYRAGFSNIAIPLYLGGVQYDHYFQFIQTDDLDKITLHVAGGMFKTEKWNKEEWTWSKEVL